jgi:hypothetical protein
MLSKNFKMIVIIIVLLLIIVFSLLFSCSDIVPYSKDNNWYYKYEGMKDISGNKTDMSGNKTDMNDNVIDLSGDKIENFVFSTNSTQQSAKKTAQQIAQQIAQRKKEKKQGFKTMEGFEGIFGTPVSTNEIIDVFSNTKSSVNCYGSGLTNSGGGLCLNEKQKQLLTTRGGNATGASSS